jgi:hypothetical protein
MKLISSFILMVLSTVMFSQNSIVLQPDAAAGKDARIFNMNSLANYGSDPDFIATQLDYSGEPGTERSVIEFNLPFLPKGATVTDARLSLFYNTESNTLGQLGDNAAVLRRLVDEWDENTVAWAQQPVYVTENEVLIPASAFPDQDYIDINVTELVKDMYEFPSTSHGFMFMLQNEQGVGKAMKFYSSDGPNPDERPRLVITYSTGVATTDIHSSPLSVTPNPFVNSIALEGLSGNYTVSISDINGKVVMNQDIESLNDILLVSDLHLLPGGMYVIRAESNEEVFVGKAIKSE